MKKIFKYHLKTTDTQIVDLPEGAQILCVQTQDGEPKLWALVEPDKPVKPVKVFIFGTGHPVHNEAIIYISSYQLMGGRLIYHVFTNHNPIT